MSILAHRDGRHVEWPSEQEDCSGVGQLPGNWPVLTTGAPKK